MHSISTEKAPAAIGPYSQGVVVNGLLFASGQIALSPETGELVGSTIEEQAEQVIPVTSYFPFFTRSHLLHCNISFVMLYYNVTK